MGSNIFLQLHMHSIVNCLSIVYFCLFIAVFVNLTILVRMLPHENIYDLWIMAAFMTFFEVSAGLILMGAILVLKKGVDYYVNYMYPNHQYTIIPNTDNILVPTSEA